MRLLLRILTAACLLGAATLLAAWTIGMLASDRWSWSQPLSFLPSLLVLPAADILWGCALAAACLARRRRRWMHAAIGAWAALATMHWALIECRIYRLSLPSRPTGPHLRILHWNVNEIYKMPPIGTVVHGHKPDVAVLVNPHGYGGWGRAPAVFGPEFTYVNAGGIVILSRVPILRFGMAWLGLEPPADRPLGWFDPGRAMYVELDTTRELGRSTILWVVDLPSERGMSRWAITTQAAEKLRLWNGIEQRPGAPSRQVTGFPAPDLIVGDFNIPRGSASLSQLAPGMRNAFDEAGVGYSATWPRAGYKTPIPLLHIDQMFTGRTLKAARYEVSDPGIGFHRLQIGDLLSEPRGASPR